MMEDKPINNGTHHDLYKGNKYLYNVWILDIKIAKINIDISNTALSFWIFIRMNKINMIMLYQDLVWVSLILC